jgi:DNA end-binding protein Ku
MAARAIWRGVLTFGAITLPVKMYTAVRSERIDFHLLHDQDETRLKQQLACGLEEKPVEREEVVRGFEVEDNRYVIVKPEEIDALAPESSRDVEVMGFVPAGKLDARYLERTYYLGPDGDAAKYAALLQALAETERAGICKWTMRKKSHVGALRAAGTTLSLVAMRFAEEVMPAGDVAVSEAKLDKRELDMAKYLIDTLKSEFRPEQFQNEYHRAVRELIERKARGEKVPARHARAPKATGSEQLLKALKESVKRAQSSRKQHAAKEIETK